MKLIYVKSKNLFLIRNLKISIETITIITTITLIKVVGVLRIKLVTCIAIN